MSDHDDSRKKPPPPQEPDETDRPGAGGREDDPMVGELLRDKWRVLERLGFGGFGTVYKVQDVKGGWVEALKILGVDRMSGAEAETMRKRFLREAQIMKSLGNQSQHIVGLSTYEEDLEAGLVYFLMEFVEGRDLAEVLAQEGPLTPERTVHLGLQICDALMVAHEAEEEVVHRDLKLENVMLTRDRRGNEVAKVLDFGIAKIAEREGDSHLTMAGTSLGTPGFAAPEQLRAETVDGRTDLFAFGVILYCLLTGRDPWFGRTAWESTDHVYELMVAAEKAEVIPFEETGVEVPRSLADVVTRLLRRDPAQRFPSARELKETLTRIVREWEAREEREEAETPAAEGMATTLLRHRGKVALSLALVLLVVGVLVVRPWGRTLTVDELEERALAGGVASARLTSAGIEGRLTLGPLPLPFRVPVEEGAAPGVVGDLRSAGLTVDTSREVDRLVRRAAAAQTEMRYFGEPGRDVRTFAQQALVLDPDSREARSLLRKVAERMAWDAEAALQDGEPQEARELARDCLGLVPGHPGCQAVVGG